MAPNRDQKAPVFIKMVQNFHLTFEKSYLIHITDKVSLLEGGLSLKTELLYLPEAPQNDHTSLFLYYSLFVKKNEGGKVAEVANDHMHRVDLYCGGMMLYHISLRGKKIK